jgi:hypothetical protein
MLEAQMSEDSNPPLDDKYPVGSPEWRWLNGTADLDESSDLAGVSTESLRRNHSDLIIRLGPRRVGMKRKDALSLGRPIKP